MRHGLGSETEFPADTFVEMLQGVKSHGDAALAINDHRQFGYEFAG